MASRKRSTYNSSQKNDDMRLIKMAVVVFLLVGLLFVLPVEDLLDKLRPSQEDAAADHVELKLYIVEKPYHTEEFRLFIE